MPNCENEQSHIIAKYDSYAFFCHYDKNKPDTLAAALDTLSWKLKELGSSVWIESECPEWIVRERDFFKDGPNPAPLNLGQSVGWRVMTRPRKSDATLYHLLKIYESIEEGKRYIITKKDDLLALGGEASHEMH